MEVRISGNYNSFRKRFQTSFKMYLLYFSVGTLLFILITGKVIWSIHLALLEVGVFWSIATTRTILYR